MRCSCVLFCSAAYASNHFESKYCSSFMQAFTKGCLCKIHESNKLSLESNDKRHIKNTGKVATYVFIWNICLWPIWKCMFCAYKITWKQRFSKYMKAITFSKRSPVEDIYLSTFFLNYLLVFFVFFVRFSWWS